MLTNNAKAIVALTTRLGSPDRKSLTAQAWSRFNNVLRDGGYAPASVFELKGSIAGIPGVEDPERIEGLLSDASAVTLEVDDLQRKGIWTTTIDDEAYPKSLVTKLGSDAPPVLFGVGDVGLLNRPSIGIVGARNIGEAGRDVAETMASEAVRIGFSVVSGGARGVDQFSMNAAYRAGGAVIGVLADSLLAQIRKPDVLTALDLGNTCLVVQQAPTTGFSPGAAMSRNKIVYALTEATVVVASDNDAGGTWAGAAEALKKQISSVLVWRGEGEGPGNSELEKRGAIPITSTSGLSAALGSSAPAAAQLSLLDGR